MTGDHPVSLWYTPTHPDSTQIVCSHRRSNLEVPPAFSAMWVVTNRVTKSGPFDNAAM